MSHQSLEEALQAAESPVQMLRNSQIGPYAFPGTPEFTNWRDEQRAWLETCVLFEQSFHMTDLYIEGPDVIRLLSDFGVNNFENFEVNKAKQFVACNHDGYVIGDAILFYLDENRVSLVGRPTAHNWVQYQAETGGYDVTLERDERMAANPAGRRNFYRYQVQGPNASDLLEELNGGPIPEIPFFNIGEITIAGRTVRALGHGMAGQPGLELFGPWEEREEVRGAIVEVGQEYGIRQVGSRTYATNTLESGWIPSPCPAIYESEEMKGYRQWLPADGYEGMASIGGSFYSDDITDYYLTPYDLGYGRFVNFNHDFVGKEALQEIADNPRREKVTLVWNGEDVTQVFRSLFEDGDTAKYIDLPLSNYATLQYDEVSKDGETAGLSTYTGYSYNERAMLSLACIDNEYSEPGTEVTVVWGEEGGGTAKPTVERHVQTEIRATVAPAPIAEFARTAYRGKSAE
ncbi:MAG: aminomethyl transferase family protein [Chloroflexota bacterium]|nr:aminomethyl transferase family protein [Chloroflexota bacterium]